MTATILPPHAEQPSGKSIPSAAGALGDRKKETVLPAAAMLGYADLAGLEAAGVELASRCPLALARYASQPAMADEHHQHRR